MSTTYGNLPAKRPKRRRIREPLTGGVPRHDARHRPYQTESFKVDGARSALGKSGRWFLFSSGALWNGFTVKDFLARVIHTQVLNAEQVCPPKTMHVRFVLKRPPASRPGCWAACWSPFTQVPCIRSTRIGIAEEGLGPLRPGRISGSTARAVSHAL